ncbi:MAG: hypothetical protein ACJ75B_06065 [Flavisolibacter sp.]
MGIEFVLAVSTRQDFEQVIESISKKLVDPTTYITHRVRFDQVKVEFEKWLNPATGVIKAMIEMNQVMIKINRKWLEDYKFSFMFYQN